MRIKSSCRMDTSTTPFALAVDDDPNILMNICGILEDAGFRCHSVDHGDAAKMMLPERAESITLLFSDVEMPGGTNGFALAHHVSKHWPWIEIVIASGHVRPEPGDMPDGATFIAKPFSAALLHQHLRDKLPDGKKPEPLRKAI